MAKNGPNMTQNDPKWPKNDPKWPKNGPRMTQNDPKWPKNFQQFFLTEKAVPQTFSLLECMVVNLKRGCNKLNYRHLSIEHEECKNIANQPGDLKYEPSENK